MDASSSSRPLLARLLEQSLAYAPEYGGGLSNHLPMVLIALDRLGASDDRLTAFADRYAQRLAPLNGGDEIAASVPARAWTQRLGQLDAYASLAHGFRDWLRRDGATVVLRTALPRLMPGVAAAAFHGLIRTAYAVDSGHAGELAAALAYWACRHLPLAAALPAATDNGDDVITWVAGLAAHDTGDRAKRRLIFERMLDVAAQDGFARHAGQLHVTTGTLQQLSSVAADRYRASCDFTVLHLATSCHALRRLLPYVEQPLQALRWYAIAFAAGLVDSGVGALPAPPGPRDPLSWRDVTKRALRSDDDHVVKLVDSCREEAQAYGDDHLYRGAAARAVTG